MHYYSKVKSNLIAWPLQKIKHVYYQYFHPVNGAKNLPTVSPLQRGKTLLGMTASRHEVSILEL